MPKKRKLKTGGSYYQPTKKQVAQVKRDKGFKRTYQAEHIVRTGKRGSPKGAQQYRNRGRKSLGGAAVGVGGLVAGYGATMGGQNITAAGLFGTSIAGALYSDYQSRRMEGQLNKETGTRRSSLGGYHKTSRNSSGGPSTTKAGNRSANKGRAQTKSPYYYRTVKNKKQRVKKGKRKKAVKR